VAFRPNSWQGTKRPARPNCDSTGLLRVGYPWPDLRWPHLLVIVVLASLFDAVAFNLAMVWIGHETLDPRLASDMVKGFAGRVVGAFAFMLLALDLKRRLLRTSA